MDGIKSMDERVTVDGSDGYQEVVAFVITLLVGTFSGEIWVNS